MTSIHGIKLISAFYHHDSFRIPDKQLSVPDQTQQSSPYSLEFLRSDFSETQQRLPALLFSKQMLCFSAFSSRIFRASSRYSC